MLLRPATAADSGFLEQMLLEAFNWAGLPNFTAARLKAEDHAWRYVDGWIRPGDFGVIAQEGDQAIGAAWAPVADGPPA